MRSLHCGIEAELTFAHQTLHLRLVKPEIFKVVFEFLPVSTWGSVFVPQLGGFCGLGELFRVMIHIAILLG
jgi:hypothetical protein